MKNMDSIEVNKPFSYYEPLLEGQDFFRTHHSYIVNLKMIESVDIEEYQIALKGDISVPLSRRRKTYLIRLLDSVMHK